MTTIGNERVGRLFLSREQGAGVLPAHPASFAPEKHEADPLEDEPYVMPPRFTLPRRECVEYFTALPPDLTDEEAVAEARRRGRLAGGFVGAVFIERTRLKDGLPFILARVESE